MRNVYVSDVMRDKRLHFEANCFYDMETRNFVKRFLHDNAESVWILDVSGTKISSAEQLICPVK